MKILAPLLIVIVALALVLPNAQVVAQTEAQSFFRIERSSPIGEE